MRATLRILGISLVATSLLPCTTLAQIDPSSGPGRRVLAKHQFQYSTAVIDPFVTTHVRTGVGAGIAGGFESTLDDGSGGTLRTYEGSLGFFMLNFEYQKNLFGWGALSLEFSGTGRTGTNGDALIADGINTIYGLYIRGKGVVVSRERAQLALHASFSRKNVFGVDILGFAQQVIDDGQITDDTALYRDDDIYRATLGGSAAYAFNRSLGATAYAEAGSAKPALDDEDNEFLFRAGAATDYDFLPVHDVPVGLALTYYYDSYPEGGVDVAKGIHSGGLAVNYTGRQDLHLGLEGLFSTVKQTDLESSITGTVIRFNFIYYF